MTNQTINVLQVATLNRPIRKDLGYGPIETVIYNIDQGLHELGHRSIVACSGDSCVSGERYTTIKKSFSEYWSKNTSAQKESSRRHLTMSLERASRGDIDIIHMHDAAMVEYIFKGVLKSPVPIVMTLHVPAEEKGSFKRWNETLTPASKVFFVPISEFQKNQNHGLVNLQEVIHHGIDIKDYPFNDAPQNDNYLFTIGRVTQDKGQDKSIEVAKRSNSRLVIAGNVQNKSKDRAFFKTLEPSINLSIDASENPGDDNYYDEVIKPVLESGLQIIYIGEINSAQKMHWYRHAQATLFPIQWGEPFGLVLVESMACGTPVLALNRGSVPEIILDRETGFIADSIDEMVEHVQDISRIDRHICRLHIQDHFSIASMAKKYSQLYQQILVERASCQKTSP